MYRYFLLFSFFMTLTLILNWGLHPEPTKGLSKLRYLLIPILGYPYIKNRFKLSQDQLFKIIMVLMAMYNVAGIYGYAKMRYCDLTSLCSKTTYLNRNGALTGIMQFGYEVPMIIMLGIYGIHLAENNKKQKNIMVFLTTTLTILLLLCNTRGGLVGFIISLGYYLFSHRKIVAMYYSKFKYYLFILCLALIPTWLANSRLLSEINLESDKIRMTLNTLSIQAFLEHPFIGYGLLHPKEQFYGYFLNGTKFILYNTHNTYTQILVDGGIFSFALYVLFFRSALLKLLKKHNPISIILLSTWFGYLVSSAVHSMFITGTTTGIILMGLVMLTFFAESESKS
jgi:O-antigen ligase